MRLAFVLFSLGTACEFGHAVVRHYPATDRSDQCLREALRATPGITAVREVRHDPGDAGFYWTGELTFSDHAPSGFIIRSGGMLVLYNGHLNGKPCRGIRGGMRIVAELAANIGRICGALPAWQEERYGLSSCSTLPSAEEELPQPEMTHDEAAAEKAARDAIELLAQHHFADALSRFDARMTAALPAGQLDDLWWYATARDGAFKAITRVTASGGLVTVRCAFQWRRRDFKVAVDPSLRIAELTALPVRDGIEWTVEPAPAAK